MVSPDGGRIAGHHAAGTGERIVVISPAGGAVTPYETVPPSATWTPDGRALLYIDTRGGISNLMRQPLSGSAPEPVTKFSAEQIFNYAIATDQKQLALVRGHVSSDVVLVSAAEK
jgi:Tol biopolymer transport system component